MFCKRMAGIHKRGKDRLEELREEHRAESERLLDVLGDVLSAAREAVDPDPASPGRADELEAAAPGADDGQDAAAAGDDDAVAGALDSQTAERAGRLVLRALEEGGGLESLAAAHQAVAAHHGNNYLPLLEQYYKSHRPTLFSLVDSLRLEATSEERSVLDAVEFIRVNRDRRGDWIEEVTAVKRDGEDVTVKVDVDSFAGEMWRKVLRDKRKPGMLARRHLEVCVFSPSGRRAALRGRRGGRVGLLCQPARPVDDLGGVPEPGPAVLRASWPARRWRPAGRPLPGQARPGRR
jgi:hypothetical protein